MSLQSLRRHGETLVAGVFGLVLTAGLAAAQAPAAGQTPAATPAARTVCGQPIPPPAKDPPPGSPPVIFQLVPCFQSQGGASVIEPETYLYYIQTKASRPSADIWVPYDDAAVKTLFGDFRRLWGTNFLDNLSIDVQDYTFSNGVIGKLIVFDLEERQRVKLVDYTGSKKIEITKLEEKLKEASAQIRLDSFIDPVLVRKVEGIALDMLREKGFPDAKVKHEIKELAGTPKLVHLTFTLDEGPLVKIRRVTFLGNKGVSSRALKRQMKSNRETWFLSFVTGRGKFQEAKLEEDADRVVAYYRDKGYVAANVGQAQLRTLQDSADGGTRWVELRVPVDEGHRYRVGEFTVAGNTVVKTEALKPLFKMKTGEFYSEKKIRKGLEKAREVYGAGGYFEFTGYPELVPSDQPQTGSETAAPPAAPASAGPPTVAVTMTMQEGKQYFVHRIGLTGNTTTRDHVVRREMALVEGGVFNTEALKYSVKRINQLGYFKPLEGQNDIAVDKTPDTDNMVDVELKVEEQNRNQITFAAGVSEYDGLFGNVSYTTANLLGRGETATVTVQRGARSNIYQVGITEPYFLDRPISLGVDLFSRKNDFLYSLDITAYSEVREGVSTTVGRPLWRFARAFLGYSYEIIDVAIRQDLLGGSSRNNPSSLAGQILFNPYLDNGRHVESRVTPTFVYDTVDNPLLPRSGHRFTGSLAMAGGRVLRGETDYVRPEAEVIWYIPLAPKMAIGMRATGAWIKPYGRTVTLPVLPAVLPGRRVPDSGCGHPDGRTDGQHVPRARRDQVRAGQLRALLRRRGAGAPGWVPRCRPGLQ